MKEYFIYKANGEFKKDKLNNPASDQFGEKITIPYMKFFAAQTKKNKPYPFTCTIISEDELNNLFEKLKLEQKSVNKKIAILTSKYTSVPHWFSAQIKIEKDTIQVCLICSIGEWRKYFDDFIKALKEHYPASNVTVYVDLTARQHDHDSCSIFTLEDIKALHKLSAYLPPVYNGDIFKYLDEKTSKQEDKEGFCLKYSQLPLIMMRATQSSQLTTKIIPSRDINERNLLINKKKETILDYVIRNFQTNPSKEVMRKNRYMLSLITTNDEPTLTALEETINENGLPVIAKGPNEQIWVAGMDSHGKLKLTKFCHTSKYPSLDFPLTTSIEGKFYLVSNKQIEEQFYIDLVTSQAHDPSTYAILNGYNYPRNDAITEKFFKTLNKTRQFLEETDNKELDEIMREFDV